MKVLLDTCVWGGAAEVLRRAGYGASWVGEMPPDHGDAAILQLALDENRVLVTLDKDFGELAIVQNQPHSGIVRLVGLPGRDKGRYCVAILERYADELSAGAILTVSSTRVRIRLGDQ